MTPHGLDTGDECVMSADKVPTLPLVDLDTWPEYSLCLDDSPILLPVDFDAEHASSAD